MTQATTDASVELKQSIAAVMQAGCEAVRAKADEDEVEAVRELAKIPEAMRKAVKGSGGQAGAKLEATIFTRGNWNRWMPLHRSTCIFLDLCEAAGVKTEIYYTGKHYPDGYRVVVEFTLCDEDVAKALLRSESQEAQMRRHVEELKLSVGGAIQAGLADRISNLNQYAGDLHAEAMGILRQLPAQMKERIAGAHRTDLEFYITLLVRTSWVKMKPVDDLTNLLVRYCSEANLRTAIWGTGQFAQTGYELRVLFTVDEVEALARTQK